MATDKGFIKADILIADDERTVRAAYRKLFECEGHTVRAVRNGKEAVEAFQEQRPDLVLLDVDMPIMNGFSACRALREIDQHVPILFLTAMASDADQVRGFGLGADDYVFKTAASSVLLARVTAVLERRATLTETTTVQDLAPSVKPEKILLGRVTVDLDTFTVFIGSHVGAQLTKNEAAILRVLNQERGKVYSREELAQAIHGAPHVIEPSAFRSYFVGLRRKLGPAGALIVTERERGYRLLK